MTKPDTKFTPTPAQEQLLGDFTAGMQRAHPRIHPDSIRELVARWRYMAEGQSFLMASTFEKCASDLEGLLL